jgi:phosphohistidine phosphatase
MKKILLMRHAKSSWDDPSLSDHQRPLNKRGKRDAPRMGQWLSESNLVPDMILCSTAERAKQTVELLLETLPFEGKIQYLDSLYHGAPDNFLDALKELPQEIEVVMFVGHNPGMEYFLEVLCDEYERMPTAAVAEISIQHQKWAEMNNYSQGNLVNLWTPREIK